MTNNNLDSGKRGEDHAVNFLIENGYEILERNYRYKRGEIDIIAKKNELVTFVEVKLRAKNIFGNPEEAVGSKKARMVMVAAENYIFEKDWNGAVRFDVISIIGKEELVHFKDAF